ncbi:N-acetylmuramoyl-L-alanine amidase [Thermaerobacter composti]|uniref:N-acetylmuramoyl-L-alanine amidase n=1 Tax=Thermaerobacter composti TaxID=554949 RepID=A0ABZ0QTV6_9FIRM|nr:N-acetylmuramoyl-L-alanine amidase [Thermaerobacter composti]WPD20167.1 N-acetylmuramoyl-L-alanine amidase [Thermaerobacter composti]
MPKVYLSPSVQEHNVGVGDYGTEEQRMQVIGALVETYLRANGFDVRRNRPEMSLKDIIIDSNRYQPDAHVAIHSNAGGGEGTEAWYYPGSEQGRKLAQAVYDEVAPLSPGKDRGLKTSSVFAELRSTVAPAVILEVGFHDNPADAAWIMSQPRQIAKAIARGICRYFGKAFKDPDTPAPAKPGGGSGTPGKGVVYRVQIGAFKNRANAEALAAKARKAGFEVWIDAVQS